MATRKFSSISVATTLASSISNVATSATVASATGNALLGGVTLTAGDQFTVALDPDTANEEIVFVTAQSTDVLTITRNRAGTSNVAHSAGASVKHVLTSDDLDAFETAVSPVASLGFSGSTSGTTTVQATAVAGTTTLTLPAATDTLVGKATTDTLTNKTLTAPVISTITNTGTVTLPTATDTLVGRATTDTLTNKTLTAPLINLAFNAQTGTTYTLVATDSSKLVTASNAAAITITIPPSIFAAGEQINVQQIGAGQVTFAAGAGVTVTSTGATSAAPKLRTQFSACTIICTASNTFTVIGDIS